MSGKALIPVVIGLCIGGFALKMVLDTVKKAQGATPNMVAVWSPTEELQRGTSFGEENLTSVKLPASLVPQGAFTKKDDLIGRVARITVTPGLPVLESMLLPKGARPGLYVKPGFRAVSVKIDESAGVSNLLQPGCIVDVIGYFKVKTGNKQDTVSRTLIQNVEVAAVGDRISVAAEKPVEKNSRAATAKPARTVTLFVKPESVPELHLAEQRGKLKLSLRNQGDDATDDAASNSVYEAAVTGEKSADESEKGLLDKMASLFQKKAQDPAPAAKPTPPPQPEEPVIKLAHRMTIWNGEQREIMGWTSFDSMDPIHLEGHAGKSRRNNRNSGSPLMTKTSDTVSKASGASPASSTPAAQAPSVQPVTPQRPYDDAQDDAPIPDDDQDTESGSDESSDSDE